MITTEFTPIASLLGGCMLGVATGVVLLLNGKIAGISGVVSRTLNPVAGDVAWRVWFLVGLVAGGGLFYRVADAPSVQSQASLVVMAIAGLLVGFGSRYGGGCTSGHGVCGLARGSKRSLLATVVFMATAFVTVYVVRHVVAS